LVLSLDRLRSSERILKQELIANTLGVRREGVTEAAGNLQRAGFIRYKRGRSRVAVCASAQTGGRVLSMLRRAIPERPLPRVRSRHPLCIARQCP
jgi:hypothetical protein